MATSVVNPATFTGNSAFSADLQQVIARAISFASLPLQQLQNRQTSLQSEQTALQTLSSQFSSLQTAVRAIDNAATTGAYTATVEDNTVATASVGSAALPGTYNVTVVNTGSRTNTLSADGLTTVTDAARGNIDSATNYTLTVDGQSFNISDPDASLNGLAQAINTSSANVQATVVNVGGSGSPDYRLSIQSLAYGPVAIGLSDSSHSLLNTLSTGSYVTHQVDGQPATPINSDSRTVTIAPGLNLDLLSTGSTTVTVAQSASGILDALNSFVSAYNTIVDQLAQSRGQNAGPLAGQSIVYSLQQSLQSLVNYTSGSGKIASLADLGLAFDDNGHLTLDTTVFNQANPSDVLNFIGSITGGGFLEAANSVLNSVDDPTTGLLATETDSISAELSDVGNKITDNQNQINQLQQNLTAQIASADALISNLEQQASYITNLFTAMQQNNKNGG